MASFTGTDPRRCKSRPKCGGATVCTECLEEGVSRAKGKLLRSPVSALQLPDVVQAVWPEASPNEVAAAAQHLLSSGVAVECAQRPGILEHRLWPLLRELCKDAVELTDPLKYVKQRGASWAEPLITSARLAAAGLHVFSRFGSSKVDVRQKTDLNAVDKATLARALRSSGIKGARLEVVYREYVGAFEDICSLESAGDVTIDEHMAWHASVVPKASPGAFQAWQRALANYKPL